MIDKNFKRIKKCLSQNRPGLSEELEKLGYHRKGNDSYASGIIVYPETNEYEELPYSEIEFKKGWNDWYDEPDAFLRDASTEYYPPKFRPGMSRFSLARVYWTDIYYSEDPEDWDEDLKEHLDLQWLDRPLITDLMMNPGNGYIGFGLEVNSEEEMDVLSKYFRDHRFSFQLRELSNPEYYQKSRVWFIPSSEGPILENPKDMYDKELLYLYLCGIRYTDYPRLREALLGLWEIEFLFEYRNGYYY